MAYDIRNVKNIIDLIGYFSQNLGWDIDIDDFEDIEDISYDFDAADIGLKEESFVKISSLRQLQPLVDGQQWGIFCVEFDSNKFEVSALRKILSGLIPRRRNSANHAVWCQQDLLFICNWGQNNNRTIGIAHFEDKETGLPQIKMISCAPALEDFTQIKVFEDRLAKLAWPKNTSNIEEWRQAWSSAFTTRYRQTIQDSSTLTIQLAAEAQNIRNCILDILKVESDNGYVHQVYEKFRNTLIHDMTEQQFADMYAQTVVYGLFSARCMDKTQDDFSAEEAIDLIPNTNPFLKNLMRECLGAQNNNKLSFDELEIGNVVDLLLHTKTDAIIADFNRQTGGGREDPVIHFYEEFLSAYDKTQKVQRGVYYTPQPVVNFIVHAVDTIIKRDFGLDDGLASTETKTIKVMRKSRRRVGNSYSIVEDTKVVPAVQILDPATGTGTFIRQVILQIYDNFKKKNKGLPVNSFKKAWNDYVPEHLLPRINAFELMMAPYAVAHMKLAMLLRDTGYDFGGKSRLNVYLTNSLEKAGNSDSQLSLWSDPLAAESIAANAVKKNTGINVVLGNPPYNISSNNRNDWIYQLISDFKQGLTERKLNLDDDYIKFLKYAQLIIETAKEGIVAFITNNSYIDGVSHRRIRESLMDSFNQIYVLDLHGNVMKQEKCPNGEKDENVFDIQQGVSIVLMVKRQGLSRFVKYYSLMGGRDKKYAFLNSKEIESIQWKDLTPIKPELLFIPYKSEVKADYEQGFKVSELFELYNSGIQTKCDEISVQRTKERLESVITFFRGQNVTTIKQAYPKKNDGRDWTFALAKKDIMNNKAVITPYYYRPFDVRYIRYSGQTKGLIAYPRRETMNCMVGKKNLALCLMKQFFQDVIYNHVFVTNLPIDERMLYSNRGGTYIFPLYQFSEITGEKFYNFKPTILKEIEKRLSLKLSVVDKKDCFSGESLTKYIYAVLHSKKYRNKYNDQLKYDFPTIPYPIDRQYFYRMVKLGDALFNLHLPDCYYRFDNEVIFKELVSYKFQGNKVILNDSLVIDGFEGLSERSLGGYKPADKWLKDHKGEMFTRSDLDVYKRIIKAISETDSIMNRIDEIIVV